MCHLSAATGDWFALQPRGLQSSAWPCCFVKDYCEIVQSRMLVNTATYTDEAAHSATGLYLLFLSHTHPSMPVLSGCILILLP